MIQAMKGLMTSVYLKALERAAALLGRPALAERLGVTEALLHFWLAGKASIPGEISEKVIDLLLQTELSQLAAPRVLVVDDDPAGAYGLAKVLKLMGYPVETAMNGVAAIAAARRLEPAIVFIDLRMPDMDGVELALRLREEPFRPRIIAATAYGEREDRERTAAAGFEAHLLKPIDAAVLERHLPRLA